MKQRTHTCGELRSADINKEVKLVGWVHTIRHKGKILWIDLRDRYGITQLVWEKERMAISFEQASCFKRGDVIQVGGKVLLRTSPNPNIETGKIEISVSNCVILNHSKTPPFTLDRETDGGEELRMQYRYLDLRRPPMQENMVLRHCLLQTIRSYLNKHQFLEIETPALMKSTPEGARDFLVPSRMQLHHFYALPQSPQTLKQLLMVAGMDRYYQIVKCFRDEDLRADRQPEFTQLDCELSFMDQEEICDLFEDMVREFYRVLKDISLPPFTSLTYKEARESYGSDKPDLRFDLSFHPLDGWIKQCNIPFLDGISYISGLCLKGQGAYTRKQLDTLTTYVKTAPLQADGLIYVKYLSEGSFKSSIDKYCTVENLQHIAEMMGATPGDLMLGIFGEKEATLDALGQLRLRLAIEHNLIDTSKVAPVWVTEFPWISWDADLKRHHAVHHPFTAPYPEDVYLLETSPTTIRAQAYDLVINGTEVGGGSIRIHERKLQEKLLHLLGFSAYEAIQQFGFLLEALEYGAPPHGGIAFGIDRICATLSGSHSIRSFIAFPKNNAGKDLMLGTPSQIDGDQLTGLGL